MKSLTGTPTSCLSSFKILETRIRERSFVFSQKYLSVDIYTDADWTCCTIDRISTSGYCTFIGCTITRMLKK
jgi:hypothetical protein